MAVVSFNKFPCIAVHYDKPFSYFSRKLIADYLAQRPFIHYYIPQSQHIVEAQCGRRRKEEGERKMLLYMYSPEISLIRALGSKVIK